MPTSLARTVGAYLESQTAFQGQRPTQVDPTLLRTVAHNLLSTVQAHTTVDRLSLHLSCF